MTLWLLFGVTVLAFVLGATTGYGRGLRDGRAVEGVRRPDAPLTGWHSLVEPARPQPGRPMPSGALRAAAAEYFADNQIVDSTEDSVEIALRESDVQLHPAAVEAFLDRLGLPGSVLDRIATVRVPEQVGVADGHRCRVEWTHRADRGVLLSVRSKVAA
jgi:hypothetical protein